MSWLINTHNDSWQWNVHSVRVLRFFYWLLFEEVAGTPSLPPACQLLSCRLPGCLPAAFLSHFGTRRQQVQTRRRSTRAACRSRIWSVCESASSPCLHLCPSGNASGSSWRHLPQLLWLFFFLLIAFIVVRTPSSKKMPRCRLSCLAGRRRYLVLPLPLSPSLWGTLLCMPQPVAVCMCFF